MQKHFLPAGICQWVIYHQRDCTLLMGEANTSCRWNAVMIYRQSGCTKNGIESFPFTDGDKKRRGDCLIYKSNKEPWGSLNYNCVIGEV